MAAIVSLRDFSWRMQYPRKRLQHVAENINAHYHVWTERNESVTRAREYQAPSDELKRIQRRLVTNILSDYELSDVVHGAVKRRSFRTNAEAHLGASTLVKVDVRNFFPSVRFEQAFAMFRRDFEFGTDVASLVTKLTTFKGRLPTGAPTSPAVANALLTALVDRFLELKAERLGVRYTRYVDDLTFSGENARLLINEAAVRMSRLGLKIYRKHGKLKVIRNCDRQSVTGLVVNSARRASAGRKRLDTIRRQIHALSHLRGGRDKAIESIRGRINHVRQFNEGAARRLMRQFEAALQNLPT